MEKCIEANPFTGVIGTGAELLWKVTHVHCCIELCWIGDKIWHLLIIPSQFSTDQFCKYSGQLKLKLKFQFLYTAFTMFTHYLKQFTTLTPSRTTHPTLVWAITLMQWDMLTYIPMQGSVRLCPLHICQVPILHLGMVRLPLEWPPNVTSRIPGRGRIRTQDLTAQSIKPDALPTELSRPGKNLDNW